MNKNIKKATIKLLPTNGKIKEGVYVRFDGVIFKVKSFNNGYIETEDGFQILIHKCQLLKYFAINNRGIIGEIEYGDYSIVDINTKVEVECRKIFSKPEIGDVIKIHRPQGLIADIWLKTNKVPVGSIISINGRKAIVEVFGLDEPIEVRRFQYKILRGNWRTICKVI